MYSSGVQYGTGDTKKEAAKCAAGAGAHKDVAGLPTKINYLRKIDPFVFEELLLEGFEAHGFRTIRNKRYTGDGGIDGGNNRKISLSYSG
ncbi:restriction endonuclease [Enterobacter hormaechei]|uniref:restriction endonuclease n=1 Tax=Enterobacter hormaechei TaxID=158836 RepID=UPI0034DD53CC